MTGLLKSCSCGSGDPKSGCEDDLGSAVRGVPSDIFDKSGEAGGGNEGELVLSWSHFP